MTIINRAEFAKCLNKSISESFSEDFLKRDEKAIQEEIKNTSKSLKEESSRKDANDFGVGALHKTAEGLLEIAEELDLASIKRLKAAATNGFHWVRFEPESVRVIFPTTPECAKRIVANPRSKD